MKYGVAFLPEKSGYAPKIQQALIVNCLFVCPGLEPGRDGIGDYSRGQAAEFARRGHAVSLLALNDGQISEQVNTFQTHEECSLATLRLPRAWGWDQKIKTAREWLVTQNPDWVFLQFAPYSFGEKGVPLAIMLRAPQLFRGFRVFLMMHEVWLGGVSIGPWKKRLWGLYMQRPIIAAFVKRLGPALVATSNPLYKIILKTGGINARLLPIPSNIPPTESARGEAEGAMRQAGVTDKTRCLLLGIFGEIQAGADYERTLRPLIERAEQEDKKTLLFLIGRNGRRAEVLRDELAAALGLRLTICPLGERSAAFISAFLARLDYGIATSPRQLLGKSGSVAAYRRHGLKILVPYKWSIPEHRRFLALAGPAFDKACGTYADPAVVCTRILRLTAAKSL